MRRPGDRLRRVALTIVVLATALLEWNMLYRLVETRTPDGDEAVTKSVWASLALYLAPSTFPLTVPLGLALGAAYCLHGIARRRKLAVGVMTSALICSAAMAVNVAWVTPERQPGVSDVALRADSRRALSPPTRGDRELTWSQHWERRDEMLRSGQTRRVREFDADYHLEWEFGTAALPLVALVIVVAQSRRATLMAAALISCAAYFVLIVASNFATLIPGLPPVVAGWAADGVCLSAMIAMTHRLSHKRR